VQEARGDAASLDSTDELIGRPAAGRDPDEDERQQELANEAEKALDRGR